MSKQYNKADRFPWIYAPDIMDLSDPKVIVGEPIQEGEVVRVARDKTPHMLPSCFRIIEDRQGNLQSVWKQSITKE